MEYLLDAKVVIGLLAQRPTILTKNRQIGSGNLTISDIIAQELCFATFKGVRRDASMATLAGLRLPIVPFENEDAIQAGEIGRHSPSSANPSAPMTC